MTRFISKMVMAIGTTVILTTGSAQAQTPATDAQNHEAHHADAQPAAPASGMPMEGGMGAMKMDDMQAMMHQCMEAHKDAKMCHHQAMEKCEMSGKKGDCEKMMKHAKTHGKTATDKM